VIWVEKGGEMGGKGERRQGGRKKKVGVVLLREGGKGRGNSPEAGERGRGVSV
jgi:hypothetical protein